ncbi:MAG TPA: hypothetical protein VK841_09745 [Polyangiaceae bacterium]|nr:hypothetical protein [Polyangiaceae bacterium]
MIRVRARIRAVVCLGVSLGGLAGCAGILGIEDRTAEEGGAPGPGSDASLPDGAGSSGTSGATSGASGTPGGAGAAGSAGTSGAAGVSGTAGVSGAAGTAGASGAGGASGATGATGTAGTSGNSGTSGTGGSPDASTDAHAGPDARGVADTGAEPDGPLTTLCTTPCPLKTGLNNPWAITSDANRVYWVELGTDFDTEDGVAASCPLAGCDSGMVVYTSTQQSPEGIATDGQNVYWGSSTGIWTCPVAGCTGQPKRVVAATTPWGVAVDATYVYWADNADDTIHRAPKTPPDSGVASDMVIDIGDDTITEPQQIAVDSNYVYVQDVNNSVWRVPVAGGTAVLLTSGPRGSVNFGLAIDSTSLYYAEPDAIFAVSKSATNGGTQIVSDVHWAQGLAIDPATDVLYWANSGSSTPGVADGTVGRVNVDGTGETLLGTQLVSPFGVTVSGDYVYWIALGNPTSSGDVGSIPNTGGLYYVSK